MSVRVLVCRVGRRPVVETLHSSDGGYLSSLQGIVGGRVECITLPNGLDLWACEEPGEDWPINRCIAVQAPELPPGFDFIIEMGEDLARPGEWGEHRIRGNFLLARHDGRGGLASVTDSDVRDVMEVFSDEDPVAAELMDRLMDR